MKNMADIELVIKIPEEKYKWIKENNPKADKNSIVGVIVHGKPLPEGHGRLIDADEIQFENTEFDTYGDYSRAFDAIDQADTIIETDKAESEEV